MMFKTELPRWWDTELWAWEWSDSRVYPLLGMASLTTEHKHTLLSFPLCKSAAFSCPLDDHVVCAKLGPLKLYDGFNGEEAATMLASKHSCPLHSTHLRSQLQQPYSDFFLSFFPSFCPSFLPSFSFHLVWGLDHQAGGMTWNCVIVSRSPYTFFLITRQILTNLPRLALNSSCSSDGPFELVILLPQFPM